MNKPGRKRGIKIQNLEDFVLVGAMLPPKVKEIIDYKWAKPRSAFPAELHSEKIDELTLYQHACLSSSRKANYRFSILWENTKSG